MDMTNRVRGPGPRSLTSMVCQLCAGFIPAAETTGKKPPADCRLADLRIIWQVGVPKMCRIALKAAGTSNQVVHKRTPDEALSQVQSIAFYFGW
jgi:hypothetical protein